MLIWVLRRAGLYVWCFFVGHDERTGSESPYAIDDRCARCFVKHPADRLNIPTMLSWIIER